VDSGNSLGPPNPSAHVLLCVLSRFFFFSQQSIIQSLNWTTVGHHCRLPFLLLPSAFHGNLPLLILPRLNSSPPNRKWIRTSSLMPSCFATFPWQQDECLDLLLPFSEDTDVPSPSYLALDSAEEILPPNAAGFPPKTPPSGLDRTVWSLFLGLSDSSFSLDAVFMTAPLLGRKDDTLCPP